MGRCLVVCGGDFDVSLLPPLEEGDLLVAADSGLSPLLAAGLRPSLCIGDFDSLGHIPSGFPVLQLPVRKDDTDLVAACRECLRRGYRDFLLFGTLGGRRFSHSLAAVQTLAWLNEQQAAAEIVDSRGRLSLLGPGERRFPPGRRDIISIFAYGGEAVLSLRGLSYPLDRYTLTPGFPLGVSNALTGEAAIITVHEGRILLVEEPEE